MPISVQWYVHNDVIVLQFIGDITLEDITVTTEEFSTLVAESDRALVHVIHDASQLTSLPINLKKITDAAGSGYKNPKVGWTVAHSVSNPVMKYIGNMVGRVFKSRYRIFSTECEALEFLDYVDSTLTLNDHISKCKE